MVLYEKLKSSCYEFSYRVLCHGIINSAMKIYVYKLGRPRSSATYYNPYCEQILQNRFVQ